MKEACSGNFYILSSGSSANVNYYSTVDFNGIMPVFPTGWFGLFFFLIQEMFLVWAMWMSEGKTLISLINVRSHLRKPRTCLLNSVD